MKKTILSTLTLVSLIFGSSIASAQQPPVELMNCIPYSQFKEVASKKYGAVKRGAGILKNGSGIIEIYFNEDSGSFVLALIMPKRGVKYACIGPHGTNWIVYDAPKGPKS